MFIFTRPLFESLNTLGSEPSSSPVGRAALVKELPAKQTLPVESDKLKRLDPPEREDHADEAEDVLPRRRCLESRECALSLPLTLFWTESSLCRRLCLEKLDSLFGFLWEVVTFALESGHWNAHFVFVSIVFY